MKKWRLKILFLIGFAGLMTAAAAAAVLFNAPGMFTAAVVLSSLAAIVPLAYMLHSFTAAMENIQSGLENNESLRSIRLSGFAEQLRKSVLNCLDHAGGSRETLENENRQLNLQMQLLQRRKTSVEAILQSIRDGVLVTDARERIVLANEAAEKLLGFHSIPRICKASMSPLPIKCFVKK